MKAFILSPARLDGQRAKTLLNPAAQFPLAVQLRRREGATIGEVFAFLSGLYFRGKLTYSLSFMGEPPDLNPIRIITTSRGLLSPEHRVRVRDLEEFASVDLSVARAAFQRPLLRDARKLKRALPADAPVVLLGSIATNKYVEPLLGVFGDRLMFPREFVGRGDMSRGGLLLRHAREARELEYVPIANAVRHGARPPKLKPIRRS
ncbi:MAG TPA: hypothetical protein VKH19_20310 [Gemmatimonadaceae bacterium]|nr:hypothetical protein [Gemmatimonadaceae bacterium]